MNLLSFKFIFVTSHSFSFCFSDYLCFSIYTNLVFSPIPSHLYKRRFHKPLMSSRSHHAIFIFLLVSMYESVICSHACWSLSSNPFLFIAPHSRTCKALPRPTPGSFMNTKIMAALYRQWEIELSCEKSLFVYRTSFWDWCKAYMYLAENGPSIYLKRQSVCDMQIALQSAYYKPSLHEKQSLN